MLRRDDLLRADGVHDAGVCEFERDGCCYCCVVVHDAFVVVSEFERYQMRMMEVVMLPDLSRSCCCSHSGGG